MAHTDVAVGIDHAFVGEDTVGDHKLAYVEVQVIHGLLLQRGVDIDRCRRCASGALSCIHIMLAGGLHAQRFPQHAQSSSALPLEVPPYSFLRGLSSTRRPSIGKTKPLFTRAHPPEPPSTPPERQLGSLAGSQQVAGWRQ